MSAVPAARPSTATRWQSFEAWVGTRSSGAALFALAFVVFALESVILPVHSGRDMGRYVQTFVQLWYDAPVLPSVLNTRGPLAALGVGVPLELGGWASEVWMGLLYAGSIVAWGVVALTFGSRAAILTTGLLLVYPGYGILFHGLAGDALFAAAFAGWAVLLSRSILRPSVTTFLLSGLGMGALVLVRPSNQVLIVMVLVPLVLRAQWGARLRWMAAFFIASAVVTQGWKALAHMRYGDGVALRPSSAVLATTLVLLLVFVPKRLRRPLVLLAIPLALVVVAVRGVSVTNPVSSIRTVAQIPAGNPFLFRVFEMDRIVSPDNGPASRELGRVVQRELLTQEPYRSYGVDLDEFFSSGSDRIFADLTSLSGVDLEAVTREAIRRHRRAFATGIADTLWQLLWSRRVYAPAGEASTGGGSASGPAQTDYIVVNGRRLPKPSEGQPIPSARAGPVVWTLGGAAREVWSSPTEHPLVFDDPRDERRYLAFGRDTDRLLFRIPTRDANQGLVHRWNQSSHVFPPPIVWLVIGLIGIAIRRPQRILVALAPTAAGLVVIVATGLIALAVAEYAAPVSPAFIVLAAAGLVGTHPRGGLRLPWRSAASE